MSSMMNRIVFVGKDLKQNQRDMAEKGFLGNFSHAVKGCIMTTVWYMLAEQSKF